MSSPALALIGAGGEIEQSTETFRRQYEDQAELCKQSPQLESVLIGQADRAVVSLQGVSAEIEAVTDAAGMRHALLTLTGEESAPAPQEDNALLAESLEDSPAVVWLKDLEGRYVRVNQRYTALLGTAADRLLGRSDADLAARETVDGPRLQERGGTVQEPLQLEYTVPAFEGRPALAALRFAVRNRDGEAIAVCGVATPLEDAGLARAEAARLIDVERWSALDAGTVRDEVLTEWGVVSDPAAVASSRPAAPMVDPGPSPLETVALAPEREHELVSALASEQARVAELERALSQAQAQARAAADVPSDRAPGALPGAAEAELERAREEAAQARAQAEQALADADAARGEAEAARREAAEALLHAERLEGSAAEWKEQAEHAEVDGHSLRARLEQAEAEVKQSRVRLEQAEADAQQSRAKVEQAEAGSQRSRSRLEEAETELQTLRTRLQQAEAAAQQSRSRVERAEADAVGLRTRLEHAEADAQQSRARLEETEAAAQRSRGRADEAEAETRTLRTRLEEAERDARALRARVEVAETAAQQSRSRMEEAETDARAQRARLEESESDARSLRARLEEAEAGARGLRSRLEDAEADAHGLRTRLEEAEADHRGLRTRLEEAETASRQARTRLEEAEASARDSRRRAELAETEVQGRSGVDSGRAEAETALRAAMAKHEAEAETALKEAIAQRELAEEALRAAVAERDAALASNAELVNDLEGQRQEVAALAEASASAAARAIELTEALNRERTRTDELVSALAPGAALEHEGAAVPALAAAAPVAEVTASPLVPSAGPDWSASAQRSLVAALAGAPEWRPGLEEAVKVLGAEGGWDVVRAWAPDEPGTLRCTAMWTALGGLSGPQTLSQEVPRTGAGSLLAQAIHSPSVTWLADIEATGDERLSASAALGMSSAVLLPIRDGVATIGLLELLTRTRIEPEPRMALSLEAAALQLGRFANQLRPRG
jgi:PAS domain S-box-containing protein